MKHSKLIPVALVAALALSLTLLLAPKIADACGSYTLSDEDLVRNTIARHAWAVSKGDKKTMRGAWDVTGGHSKTLVSIDGTQQVRAESVGRAFSRWAKNKDSKLKWDIKTLDVDNQAAFAKVAITWNGQNRVEYLTLLKVNGIWKLVGKVHVAADGSVPKTKSGLKTASNY